MLFPMQLILKSKTTYSQLIKIAIILLFYTINNNKLISHGLSYKVESQSTYYNVYISVVQRLFDYGVIGLNVYINICCSSRISAKTFNVRWVVYVTTEIVIV